MPRVSDMIQSKFLRKEDFDEDRIMTIRSLALEDMPGDDGTQKWVLYFTEDRKGMALNITTIRVLEAAFGDHSDKWIGKRVKVYVDPNVSFGGKVVGGLRLMPPRGVKAGNGAPHPNAPVGAELTPTSPVTPRSHDPEFDDNVPF